MEKTFGYFQEYITIDKGRNSCLSWYQVLSFVNPQTYVINRISQVFYEESLPYNVHTSQERLSWFWEFVMISYWKYKFFTCSILLIN